MQTQVKSVMKSDPDIISPDRTLKEAAQRMESLDCGVLPVGTRDKLEGMITDRDIVVRALSKGKDIAQTKVSECMTAEVFYCVQEDTLQHAAELMHANHVSRLVVKDRSGKVCGMLSFGCILRKHSDMHEIGNIVGCAFGKKAA